MIITKDNFKNEGIYTFIDDNAFRNEVAYNVALSNENKITVNELNSILGISKKKLWEIQHGICKDFNAINNYINFFGNNLNIENGRLSNLQRG